MRTLISRKEKNLWKSLYARISFFNKERIEREENYIAAA